MVFKEFSVVSAIYLGFSWCIQLPVMEKNCLFWILCIILIWYDSCCTNLICYHYCNLIYYDVATCFFMMLLWFNLFLLYCCDLSSSLLCSIALWVDMSYKQFYGIYCDTCMMLCKWINNVCISFGFTL